MKMWCCISIQLMKKLPPFRVFERWLLDYEPVVGVLNYLIHHGARWIYNRRRTICKKTDSPIVITTVQFDGVFNTFHYKSIEHLFPYRTQYEKTSWWSLDRYMFTAVELIFRGQALMFVPITVSNPTQIAHTQRVCRTWVYTGKITSTLFEQKLL